MPPVSIAGKTCRCAVKHPGTKHCPCRPRIKAKPLPPIKSKPVSCQVKEYFSLAELAFLIWWALRKLGLTPFTVARISGAIRALNLRSDVTEYNTDVVGCVIFRQQTMVHKTKLPALQTYIEDRYLKQE